MASERPSKLVSNDVGPIRFRHVDGAYLVTNAWGRWALLQPEQFRSLIEGSLAQDSALCAELEAKGFIRNTLDVNEAARTFARRRSSVPWGPYWHLIRLRPERPESATDRMSAETAEACLDVAFRSTSPRLEVGLAGVDLAADDEPLESIVDSAERRRREVGKELRLHLWSDLAGLDARRRDWLSERGFFVHVLVGPAALTNRDEPLREHVRRLAEAASAEGGSSALEVVFPFHRELLGRAEDLVAWCTELGCERLRLTPPPPRRPAEDPELPDIDDWLDFREQLVSALLAVEERGERLAEHEMVLLAKRIFGDEDPFDPMLRSPAADGIGQLGYAWDGTVCTSDAGRRLYEEGDSTFVIGKATEDGYRALMRHPTVRAVVVASVLEGQPGCVDCAYQPFCGQSPVHNYVEQGSIQGRMADSSWCHRRMAASDALFTRLHRDEAGTRATLRRWAGIPPASSSV